MIRSRRGRTVGAPTPSVIEGMGRSAHWDRLRREGQSEARIVLAAAEPAFSDGVVPGMLCFCGLPTRGMPDKEGRMLAPADG